ncbi:hypothetical protein NCS57_00538700 [Fusarium keratoplasticum]|uniref:Uncharacterized protein n=1 Tax=Fusarium keratoplasticum TaxID=1328300 RepID=A0ACC0QYM3_9HYPO|nr:hypothetical protein NCS57_00538700 [Fusarium keratoplasticum]KAI8670663.1 hypothetical protein NCS57_00538700 [Fusarium keratoplasticum]
MARHFVALLAAFGALGADAAVCRPSGSTTLATTTTEASSTVSVGSSTATETSSTISVESTTATESSTINIETSTTITEASTSTQESSTVVSTTATTSSAEVCVETQILANPSFDDNDSGTPWVFNEGTRFTGELARSYPYGVIASLTQADRTRQFSQTIPRVSPHNYRLQYYLLNYSAVSAPFFTCYVTPSINGQELAQGTEVGTLGQLGWQQGEAFWSTPSETEDVTDVEVIFNVSCDGDFYLVLIALDDTSLTRVCGAQ